MGFGISSTWNTPNWGMWNTPTFNNLNTFDFSNNNIWATPSSSGSSTMSTENETYEQYKKRMEKESKEAEKSSNNAELNTIKEDIRKELKLDTQKKAIEETKAQVEKSKKSDGSSSTRTPHKKQGFWGKMGRWLSNAGTAIANVGKQFIGIDKDGKWNWKKCLKNVAITAAAVGACFIPVVGPAIGYGLAATGVAMGGIGVAKGISNLNKAKANDDEAIDNAQQEIMTGAFVGLTSAFGLRGIGKGVSTANASTAATRSGVLGKVVQNTSQFGRDITINALRATGEAMKADRALIAAQNGGKVTSFFKAWGKKMSVAPKGNNDFESAYKEKYNNLKTDLETRMNEINSKLATETNASKRALLQEEKSMLEINLKEFNSLDNTVTTKADFDKLVKDNASHFNKEYATILDNTAFKTSISAKRLKLFNKSVKKFQNNYSKKLTELVKAKNKEMYLKASNPDKYASELKAFVPNRDVSKGCLKPSTWRKNEYQLAIGNQGGKGYIKTTLTHPVSTVPKAFAIFDPIYSTPYFYGEEISSDQYEATIESLTTQTTAIDNLDKKIDDCKTVAEAKALKEEYKKLMQQSSDTPTPSPEKSEQNLVA